MINNLIAQQFLNRLGKALVFPVNVMNTQGIVIASTVSDNLGEFRGGAYDTVQKRLPALMVVEPAREAGGACGPAVFYPIYEAGEISGVVEVEGNPNETQEIAKTIKISLETLADENRRRSEPEQNRFGGELAKMLLHDAVGNPQLIRRVSQKYNYFDDQARLPILIQAGLHPNCARLEQALFQRYQTLETYHSQDILLELESERVLLFKYLPDISINCKFVADEVVACLDEFFARVDPDTDTQSLFYFYGPIQLHFADYASVYQCICWMERHLRSSPEHINRFSSYLPEFLLKNISEDTLRPIFDASIYRIEKLWDIQVFVETVAALIGANLKLEAAAQKLYLHKNTVVFRLNKIKEVLGLDPINHIRDANYLIMLYNYWKYYYYK